VSHGTCYTYDTNLITFPHEKFLVHICTQNMLVNHTDDLLCLYLHTIGSQFFFNFLRFSFDSSLLFHTFKFGIFITVKIHIVVLRVETPCSLAWVITYCLQCHQLQHHIMTILHLFTSHNSLQNFHKQESGTCTTLSTSQYLSTKYLQT
jgi:hypothetical protein